MLTLDIKCLIFCITRDSIGSFSVWSSLPHFSVGINRRDLDLWKEKFFCTFTCVQNALIISAWIPSRNCCTEEDCGNQERSEEERGKKKGSPISACLFYADLRSQLEVKLRRGRSQKF